MPSIWKARHALLAFAVVVLSACLPDEGGTTTPPKLVTAQDSTLYAVGQGLAGQFNLHELFTADELVFINQGFNDGVLGTGEFDLTQHLEAMNLMIQTRRKERATVLQAEGDAFVEQEAKKPGAVVTESGLVYFEEVAGTGASPASVEETVLVHYEGSFTNGTVFDSSYRRGEPTKFKVGQVIPGWTEALQLMKEGGKARLVIPARLAYGERGQGGTIPPNVPLVFTVELIEVVR